MLSTAPKNRRRRRRRHKRSVAANNPSESNNANVDDDDSIDDKIEETEKSRTFSPRVNSKFINDDVEIETAMLLHQLNKDSEFALKKERAIEFFTSSLSSEGLKHLGHLRKEVAEPKNDEQIEIMPSPDVAQQPYPTEGPQLALSYLNEELEFEPVVVPFDKNTSISFEEYHFYLPALTLPKELPGDIEATLGETIFKRNIIDEGHFVKSIPNISRINRAQFINRLFEEGALHWYDFNQKEIKNLRNITLSQRLIKTFCAETFHPIDYPRTNICLELDALQDRILKIHIKNIYFDIHPSFNEEQRLARELESLYDEFVAIKQSDILTKIDTKLKILRQLLETVGKSGKNKSQKRSTLSNLQVHRDELKELRATWHKESARNREIIKSILEKWAQLKRLREGLSEPTTSIKLLIKVQETDAEQDEYEWSERFELEHREMMDEAMELYRWQKAQRKKGAKTREGKNEEQAKDQDVNEGNVEIVKPKPSKIEEELLNIFSNSMRPPGEQIIDFELEVNNTATMKSPPKYVVRLILDDGHLDFPESTKLNNVGQAQFNAVYTIKFTTKIPKQMKFQIFERTNLTVTKKVAEVQFQTPPETEIYLPNGLSHIDFESQSGKKYVGKIIYCIGWAPSDIESEMKSYASDTIAKSVSAPIQGTVGQWFSDQLIDPMDPENSTLACVMDKPSKTDTNSSQQINQRRKNLFRLNEDIYAFCERDKLNDNKRIELLHARFNSDLKLKNCKLVPHNEIEIEIPVDLQIFEDMLWVDPIDVQRYQGKKYLKHVYDIITNHCEVINRNYEHRDLLIGDTPPTLYGALEAFTNIFSPRRPLNPHRKTLFRKSNFHEDRVNRFNIIINVVRASGIPFRNLNEMNVNRRPSLGSAMQNLHRLANVRPFITATFRDKTLRTSTVDGSSPTWNEQIVIPINEGINQIKDSLWFHMYDEIIEDLPSNDNTMTPTSEIYQRISSHYLGEILIPFSTIYASQRIEGTFEMSTPLVLLGYAKPAVNVPANGTEGGLIETRQSILISLLISIEPIIEITHFSTSHVECIELSAIKNRIALWLSEITDEFPDRSQDPLVSLANGKLVCITRLVGAIDIPFERNETSEYMIRRFVSLIPVRPHKNVCTKLNGVWLTNDQTLNILIASPKDLGVLLTCFYLSLGFNAYLVLGFAVPYGDTTFVLTKENGECFLIDPHTSRKYSSRDTFCALMKVYCIVNPKNVWANIQRESRVFMQNFDTSQSTEWRELFTKSTPAPNELVHDLTLQYTDSLDCSNLKKSIETKIMKRFRAWRLKRKTVWNKRYTEIMLQILKDLEEDQCFGVEQKTYTNKLIESTQTKYKISGYPINMPYVSIAKIIERVKATEIHSNSDQKVEFALAVHIQSYPMNIFSVWVFILALIPIG